MRTKIVEISRTAPLPYLLITVKTMVLQKVSVVICKISRLFPNRVSADRKYSLLNRNNLTQPIQMQLSRKQKTFSDFFSAFLKSSLNFKHFQKKDDSHR